MRREPKEELVKKCQSIPGGSDTSAMSKEGPFLDGDKSTMVDVLALALFWQRSLNDTNPCVSSSSSVLSSLHLFFSASNTELTPQLVFVSQ
jgi:hypothetical protein